MEQWIYLEKDKHIFKVSSLGKIIVIGSGKGNFIKKLEPKDFSETGGYKNSRYLSTHGFYVHRLVAEAFLGEGENIAEESLKFDFVKLSQKRVGGALTLSSQLIGDSSIDLENYVGNLLARRTARAIEKSILVGDGVNEFQGIVNDEFINNVEVVGEVTMDDLQDMYLKVHPEFLKGASFIMARDFFNKMAKLKDHNGNYYLQNGVVNGKITYTIFGTPVEITESLPAENPVIFGNLEEGVSMMVKRGAKLQKIGGDTQQSLRGSVLFVYDFYADSAVANPQALVKMTVTV